MTSCWVVGEIYFSQLSFNPPEDLHELEVLDSILVPRKCKCPHSSQHKRPASYDHYNCGQLLNNCPTTGFKTTQARGGHIPTCKSNPNPKPATLHIHISCVEGPTVLVECERHWQWTASIADDRLQFYTKHHTCARSGSDARKLATRLCKQDARRAFPGRLIEFERTEKPRDEEPSPWRPLEAAAQNFLRDAIMAETFKALHSRRGYSALHVYVRSLGPRCECQSMQGLEGKFQKQFSPTTVGDIGDLGLGTEDLEAIVEVLGAEVEGDGGSAVPAPNSAFQYGCRGHHLGG
ncbi:uncharacterized protein ACA1_360600 [Acanthamoeba castellanii str. Neff]|uniref:Uncharacterized protein n=1 Tax=Acanthamoeba castellanii (strain ATCC 30010 / Neff) TaxID=1257118 RepID=L8HBZ0_ACACF|nr:uncharacterized protein ACA1_360600 [Acanthamoeba castellanii str. Neff]ELR23044.1 hypothetical protein ACA1_360600 [Acanthamoeba castellanii str. Neff]